MSDVLSSKYLTRDNRPTIRQLFEKLGINKGEHDENVRAALEELITLRNHKGKA